MPRKKYIVADGHRRSYAAYCSGKSVPVAIRHEDSPMSKLDQNRLGCKTYGEYVQQRLSNNRVNKKPILFHKLKVRSVKPLSRSLDKEFSESYQTVGNAIKNLDAQTVSRMGQKHAGRYKMVNPSMLSQTLYSSQDGIKDSLRTGLGVEELAQEFRNNHFIVEPNNPIVLVEVSDLDKMVASDTAALASSHSQVAIPKTVKAVRNDNVENLSKQLSQISVFHSPSTPNKLLENGNTNRKALNTLNIHKGPLYTDVVKMSCE